MPILNLLFEGTGNSPEAARQPGYAPDNVQILRDMLLAVDQPGRSASFNFEEGWEIDQFQCADTECVSFYLRGLGAPQLDATGKPIAWKWNPKSFFNDAKEVYRKFKATEDEVVAAGI